MSVGFLESVQSGSWIKNYSFPFCTSYVFHRMRKYLNFLSCVPVGKKKSGQRHILAVDEHFKLLNRVQFLSYVIFDDSVPS